MAAGVLANNFGIAGHRAAGLGQLHRHGLLGVDQVHQDGAVQCRTPRHAGTLRPGPHRGGLAVGTDALKPVARRGAIGDVQRLIGRVHAHAAAGSHPAQRGGRCGLAHRRRLLNPNHFAGQRFRIVGESGVTGIAGLNDQCRRAGEDQRAGVAAGALRDSGQQVFGYVAVGDADHPVVGRGADVGVHQPVLGIGGRQRDVHEAAVTGTVHRDDQFHLWLRADRDFFDRTGCALSDQGGLRVGTHDEPAGRFQAALHHPRSRAGLGERFGRQWRGWGWGGWRTGCQFRRGGERLGDRIVETCATRGAQGGRRTQHGQACGDRPAHSHARQVTDTPTLSATVPVISRCRADSPGPASAALIHGLRLVWTYACRCDEPESPTRLAATRGLRGAAGIGPVG